jgi:hypothetical protein
MFEVSSLGASSGCCRPRGVQNHRRNPIGLPPASFSFGALRCHSLTALLNQHPPTFKHHF